MMTFINNSAPVRAAIMVLLSIFCMGYTNTINRPNSDALTMLLLSLPGYHEMIEEEPHGAYTGLSGVDEIRIFSAADTSAREFAVIKVSGEENVDNAITVCQMRARELLDEFGENPEELLRVKYFHIVNVDDFVTFTVYDTNSTAENAIHQYFEKLN